MQQDADIYHGLGSHYLQSSLRVNNNKQQQQQQPE
jgi:hypothetical protein